MKWNLVPDFAMKMGLKWKTILGLGFLLTSALLIMGGVIYSQGMRLAVNELLAKTGGIIEKDTLEIEEFVKSSKGDLMVMANMPPIQGLIRARDNGGIDPLTGDKTEYWNARLVQIFSAFLRYHPEYCQLRYLDEKGNELVRVELTGPEIKVTPKEALQNKAQYPYFTETMQLKENEVYYSEVNLNREQGVIQIPHTPVFRIATPVYDAQKRVRGIVVINIVAETMFAKIRPMTAGTQHYIINQDGYFLVHPDKAKEFGFDLGFDYRITQALPEFVDELKARDFNVQIHAEDNHIHSFRKIFFDPKNRGRYWAVVKHIPAAEVLKNVSRSRDTMLVVGLLIIGSSLIIITWIFTRRMVTPILNLAKAVTRIEQGDFSARVPEDGRKDELGELALSVNRMAATIEKNLNELTILNHITIAATSSLSLQGTANSVLDAILELQLLKLEKKSAIFLADEKTRTLKLLAARGFSKEQETLDGVVPFGDCLCGEAAETGEMIFSERCCDDPRHTRTYPGITPHGHIIIPLKSGDTVLGVLSLYLAVDTKIAPKETQLYRSIADVIAVSLQNALHFADINRLKNQQGLILNSMGEGLYDLDSEGLCTFINPTAERMLGYAPGELTGALLHAITHHTRADGSAYPQEECRIYASFKENAVQHVEDEVFWRKDGSSFPVAYTSTPIRDATGTALGAVVVFSDITERRRAEQQLRAAQAFSDDLINSIPGILFCASPDGRFLRWNNIFETTLEYSGEAVARMHPLEFVAPEERALVEEKIREALRLGKAEAEVTLLTSSGRRLPYQLVAQMIQVNSLPALLGVGIDITLRKEAEDKVKEYAVGLEKLVEDRTAELGSTNKELASRQTELLTLLEASRAILALKGFDTIARAIFDSCKKLIGATAGYVALLNKDETQNEVLFLDAGGRPCAVDRSLPMPLRGLRETAYHGGKIVFANEFMGSEWAGLMPKGHARLDNVLFAPLMMNGKAHGVIGLANKPGGFTEDDSRTVSAFAELLAIAYRNDKALELLQNSEERFRAVVQTATVAIVNIDEYGKIVFWNKAAENIFGYSAEEALGNLVTLIIPERLRNDHLRGMDRIVSTEGSKIIGKTLEVFGLKKDGSEFPVELSVSPWESKEGRFFTGILHDITDKKLAEKEVLTAKEAAEAANRAKSDFLANMSHELRTPLNAIIGFSDIMINGLTGPLTDEQADFLSDIGSSGKHLLTLINDILDLSKVEAGKMELETSEIEVKELIERCLVMFKEKSLKHGIHVEYTVEETLGTIIADEMKLKQVIVNLLSNAFKFTLDGGSISVRARLIADFGLRIADLEKEGRLSAVGVGTLADPAFPIPHSAIEISVADTGPGIIAADIPKLFQPFQQLATTFSKKIPGTGLGLNLCKKFIELHGGRIWIESEVGKGSTFLFVLPVLPPG